MVLPGAYHMQIQNIGSFMAKLAVISVLVASAASANSVTTSTSTDHAPPFCVGVSWPSTGTTCTSSWGFRDVTIDQDLVENGYVLSTWKLDQNTLAVNTVFDSGLIVDLYHTSWVSSRSEERGGFTTFDGGHTIFRNIWKSSTTGLEQTTRNEDVCDDDDTLTCVSALNVGKSITTTSWWSETSTYDIFNNLIGKSFSSDWYQQPPVTWSDPYSYKYDRYPSVTIGGDGLAMSSMMAFSADSADAPEPGTVGLIFVGLATVIFLRRKVS